MAWAAERAKVHSQGSRLRRRPIQAEGDSGADNYVGDAGSEAALGEAAKTWEGVLPVSQLSSFFRLRKKRKYQSLLEYLSISGPELTVARVSISAGGEPMNRSTKLIACLALPFSLFGQTQVDLRTQSKTVDFSNAPSTRPVRTGTAIPSICQTGELFYNLTAPAGQNLYGCTATNIWTLESGSGGGGGGGGGGATMAAQLGDLNVSITTPNTVLTIGANCSAATPCNVRVGDTVYAFTTSAVATIFTGSPVAYIYVDSSGNRSVGVASGTVGCNANCSVTNVSGFPAGSVALWTWSAGGGAWVVNGGTDMRGWLGVKPNTAAGAALIQSGNQISFDTTTGLQQTIPNAASPGTTAGLLVKLAGGQVSVAATADTSGVIGICSLNCGTAGTATIVVVGLSICIADNTVSAGDYIQIGTSTAGRCKSAGTAKPGSGQILGRGLTSAIAGNSFSVLLYAAP
jgi:hypothetical protein